MRAAAVQGAARSVWRLRRRSFSVCRIHYWILLLEGVGRFDADTTHFTVDGRVCGALATWHCCRLFLLFDERLRLQRPWRSPPQCTGSRTKTIYFGSCVRLRMNEYCVIIHCCRPPRHCFPPGWFGPKQRWLEAACGCLLPPLRPCRTE